MFQSGWSKKNLLQGLFFSIMHSTNSHVVCRVLPRVEKVVYSGAKQYGKLNNFDTESKLNFATHSELWFKITDSGRLSEPWSDMWLRLLKYHSLCQAIVSQIEISPRHMVSYSKSWCAHYVSSSSAILPHKLDICTKYYANMNRFLPKRQVLTV